MQSTIASKDAYDAADNKEPYETDENTYFRGWYIIKNFNDINDDSICRSIMYLNENKNNMKYF